VLANGVHYLLGLPVYLVFWIVFKELGDPGVALSVHFLWLPLVILTQLILSLGLGLILAALAVHFRDIRDILANTLTLWFFLTPIIYPRSFLRTMAEADDATWVPKAVAAVLDLNPMTHIMDGYHLSIFDGTLINWKRMTVTFVVSAIIFVVGYWFFDRLRDSFPEEV
jgi:ABC-type polysaccharide/polyol phosphate export permease